MSLSDGGVQATMPVAPVNSSNGGGFGWGGEGSWFIIILFLFAFLGWGTSDFANVERKIESVNQGLCDGFYQQAQLVNGTNMAMANGFAQAELSRSNQQAALMQQLNAMQMQAANCCCENRAAIAQVRYDMATQACDTRNTVNTAARDIIDNQNQNSRAILDFLTQSKLQDLQSANQELRLQASQAAQNNYLISQLRPTPIPAYQSCNPWAGGSYTGCAGCCA